LKVQDHADIQAKLFRMVGPATANELTPRQSWMVTCGETGHIFGL